MVVESERTLLHNTNAFSLSLSICRTRVLLIALYYYAFGQEKTRLQFVVGYTKCYMTDRNVAGADILLVWKLDV